MGLNMYVDEIEQIKKVGGQFTIVLCEKQSYQTFYSYMSSFF